MVIHDSGIQILDGLLPHEMFVFCSGCPVRHFIESRLTKSNTVKVTA
jgi:hypothetical protein